MDYHPDFKPELALITEVDPCSFISETSEKFVNRIQTAIEKLKLMKIKHQCRNFLSVIVKKYQNKVTTDIRQDRNINVDPHTGISIVAKTSPRSQNTQIKKRQRRIRQNAASLRQ